MRPPTTDLAVTVPTRTRFVTLAFLCSMALILYLDRVCIAQALEPMKRAFGWSNTQASLVLMSFTLAYGLFEIPTGRLGDLYGSRGVLTRIVLWWSAFTALTGVVTSYPLLLGIRSLFGAGEAGAFPNAAVSIAAWFPVGERGRAFGFLSMAMQAGGALAPLLVVPIQIRYGWRASFYVFAFVGALWAVFWYFWFRNTPAEKPGVTIAELEEIGTAPGSLGHNMPWGIAMRSTNFWAILGMAMCFGYGSYFFIAWLPTYLVRARAFSEKELLLSMMPFVFGGIANVGSGFISDHLLKRRSLRTARRRVGLIGLSSGCVFVLLAAATHSKVGTIFLLSMCYAGISLNQPMTFPVCIDVARKFPGAMSGAMNMAAQAGSFLSGVVFGYMVKITGSYDTPLIVLAVVLGLGALMWLRIDPLEEVVPRGQEQISAIG